MLERQPEVQPQAEERVHRMLSCLEQGSVHQDWGICSRRDWGRNSSPLKILLGKHCPLGHMAKGTHDGKRCSQVPLIPTNPTQSGIWLRDTTNNQVSSSDGPMAHTKGNLCSSTRQRSDLDLSNLIGNEYNQRDVLMLCKPNAEPFFPSVEVETGSTQSSPILLWIHY